MKTHYLWAGSFLAVSVGLITYGAVQGVKASQHALSKGEDRHAGPPRGEISGTHAEQESGNVPVQQREGLRAQMQAAIRLGQAGQLDQAVHALEDLAKKHPRQEALWLNLGIARGGVGDLDGAEKAFETVLALEPNDYDAVAELANIALEKGNLDEAIELAQRVPAGEGRMYERFKSDVRWRRHEGDSRVVALRARHGLSAPPNTSERVQRDLERLRREAAAHHEQPTSMPSSQPAPSSQPVVRSDEHVLAQDIDRAETSSSAAFEDEVPAAARASELAVTASVSAAGLPPANPSVALTASVSEDSYSVVKLSEVTTSSVSVEESQGKPEAPSPGSASSMPSKRTEENATEGSSSSIDVHKLGLSPNHL